MTTIATDGKSIAADSMQNGSFTHQGKFKKIVKIQGGFAGGAGDSGPCDLVMNWLADKAERPSLSDNDEIAVLILRESGVFVMENNLYEIPVGAPFAVGSGEVAAMAAMLCGKSPQKAVEIASILDPYTGGKVDTYRL